ncbi:MAG TPA: type II toxin-antitoxin system VapC family toxin [Candidatus Binatia bacterium]|nr:type II toxin-antitoxin system VapC family toxin [Candidatus Binatia bacterium]
MTVFIDTAIVMYAAGTDHPLRAPCRAIVRAIGDGRLDAVTNSEVVQEILHRYGAIGRRQEGIALAAATLDLFAPVLPVTHALVRRVPALMEHYPALSARDAIHVATCLHEGIGEIVSPDRAFDGIPGLRRIDPAAMVIPPA